MVKIKKVKDLTNEEALNICHKNGKKPCAKCPLYIDIYSCFKSSTNRKYLNDKLNTEVKINV